MKQGRGDSTCRYFNTYDTIIDEFGDSALIATGIFADIYVVRYNLVEWTCTYGYRVVDSAWGVWMAPYANSDGRFLPWYGVSKAGEGELWEVFQKIREKAYSKSLQSVTTQYYYVTGKELYTRSSSSRYFGIAIPVGTVAAGANPHIAAVVSALSVGLDIGGEGAEIFPFLSKCDYTADRTVTYYPLYYEYRSYLIREEGKYYNVPIMAIWP
ncbi:MAG: hypothetical protein ACK4SY_05585 [Pyrobaculum sp.]